MKEREKEQGSGVSGAQLTYKFPMAIMDCHGLSGSKYLTIL